MSAEASARRTFPAKKCSATNGNGCFLVDSILEVFPAAITSGVEKCVAAC